MSALVERTCTEVDRDDQGGALRGESRPLRGFQSRRALVLLGDPGAGKTTEFRKECQALGSTAEYVKARDFIHLDIASRPEWRERVLFIDGLDEIRAGARDSRQPLDNIRGRLDQLRPPGFRISCREADWLGRNDRENLAKVTPSGKVTVVRLDPLDDGTISELLASQINGNADDLIAESRRRGVWPLLKNPLMLKLLAGVTPHSQRWPESRYETFEMACEELATEQNEEHRIAAPLRSADIMMAGGFLCAVQLLSGLEGYSRHGDIDSSVYVGLDDIQAPPGMTRETLEGALRTKLFAAGADGRFHPYHRQVAEFLGGRYLADLIKRGLPPRRVMSLMTSPSDGCVVTALRGLSAWLAVHCPEARSLLIEADPIGVGLYGDVAGFTREDKIDLLRSFAGIAEREPASALYGNHTAWTLRPLVSADTVDVIHHLIRGQSEAPSSDPLVGLLCRILSQVDEDVDTVASLAPSLYAVVRNVGRSPGVRTDALDAYLNVAPSSDTKRLMLEELLEASQDSALLDPDDEIRGTLLKVLYPDRLPPTQVWRYAAPRNNKSLYGRYERFWNQDLAEASSKQQMADLLDALDRGASQTLPLLVAAGFGDLPLRLLARAVRWIGDDVTVDRLGNWLRMVNRLELRGRYVEPRDVEGISSWLEQRPQTQKGIILEQLAADPGDNQYGSSLMSLRRTLQRSRLPSDLGLWSLEQALDRASAEPALAFKLLRIAHQTLQDPSLSEGLTGGGIGRAVSEHGDLAREFDRLNLPRTAPGFDRDSEGRREIDQLVEERRLERRQERAEWKQLLSAHETELWDNTFSPANLDTLALVYFGAFDDDASTSPFERLCSFLGGDRRLAEAVMAALRGALWRDDVPDVDETISIASQSKRPYLAHPVQASMHLLMDGCDPVRPVEDSHRRRGLAMCFLFPRHSQETRRCLAAWFQQDPALILDVLHRCAAAAIRKGEEYIPAVHELDLLEGRDDLVNSARLGLLDAFPPRPPNRQFPQFDSLLGKVLQHSDMTPLALLAEKKLALKSLGVGHRVRWMIVTAFLLGGAHLRQLESYVTANERRVRHMAESLGKIFAYPGRDSILTHCRDSGFLASLISILGPYYRPQELNGVRRVTVEIRTYHLLESVVGQLSKLADAETRDRLKELVERPELARWRKRLTWALQTQRVLLRDASYDQPGIAQVQATLGNLAPANVPDLAALLLDQLHGISKNIRGGSSNLWRQFWNVDSCSRFIEARPEDSCRDVLLESLQQRLPSEIDATPEGRYAADRRADIRVFYAGFNVPIEIKRNSHRHLWSALHSQLIDRYTTDPATSGYGIYLVLWFGADKTTPPPTGRRPTTPEDLNRQLEEQLTPDEKLKISVVVVDVTKPGQH